MTGDPFRPIGSWHARAARKKSGAYKHIRQDKMLQKRDNLPRPFIVVGNLVFFFFFYLFLLGHCSLSLALFLSRSFSRSLSLALFLSLSFSRSLSLALFLSLSFSRSLSLALF